MGPSYVPSPAPKGSEVRVPVSSSHRGFTGIQNKGGHIRGLLWKVYHGRRST